MNQMEIILNNKFVIVRKQMAFSVIASEDKPSAAISNALYVWRLLRPKGLVMTCERLKVAFGMKNSRIQTRKVNLSDK